MPSMAHPALGTSRTVPATLVHFLLFHRVLPLKGQQTSVAMPSMAQPTLAASGGVVLLFKICSFYSQHTAFLRCLP